VGQWARTITSAETVELLDIACGLNAAPPHTTTSLAYRDKRLHQPVDPCRVSTCNQHAIAGGPLWPITHTTHRSRPGKMQAQLGFT
jgi:hypothetical protein